MSAPAEDVYYMRRGDTRKIRVTATESGSALNLTGATFFCTGKRSRSDADASAVFALDSVNESTQFAVGSISSGIVDVTILPANTSGLTAKTILLCDVQVKDTAGTGVYTYPFTLQVDLDSTVTTST